MQDARMAVSVSWPSKIVRLGCEAVVGRMERSFCLERTKALVLMVSLGESGWRFVVGGRRGFSFQLDLLRPGWRRWALWRIEAG